MKDFIALTVAAALTALSYVICGYFANDATKGVGTGFSQGELKIIPWVVFVITYVSIRKSGTSPKPTHLKDKMESTNPNSDEGQKPDGKQD